MDCQPNQDERLLEAMESCRPGCRLSSKDGNRDCDDPALAPLAERLAADPVLAQRFEQIQRLDTSLSAAFRDVPVPEGLAGRILTRLAASKSTPSPLPELSNLTSPPAGDAVAAVLRPPQRVSRRWLLVAAGSLSAAAVLALVLTRGVETPEYTKSGALEEATAMFLRQNSMDGTPIGDQMPPAGFPLSNEIRDELRTPQVRWRNVEGLLDRDGVAYDLVGHNGARATLYVLRQTVAGLPSEPPITPQLPTGGCSAAAWKEGDLVYILVVAGDARAYQGFLNVSRGPYA
jgi:hypothetical protein